MKIGAVFSRKEAVFCEKTKTQWPLFMTWLLKEAVGSELSQREGWFDKKKKRKKKTQHLIGKNSKGIAIAHSSRIVLSRSFSPIRSSPIVVANDVQSCCLI